MNSTTDDASERRRPPSMANGQWVGESRQCGDHFVVPPCAGNKQDRRFRAYDHVMTCEQACLNETLFHLQAEEVTGDDEASVSLAIVNDIIARINSVVSKESSWIIEMIENLLHTAFWLRKCTTKTDYMACVALSYRLITGQSVGLSVWQAFGGSDLQADIFTEGVSRARGLFENANRISNDPLLRKIKQIYTYMLVHGFLSKVGLNVSVEEYIQMEGKVPIKSDGTILLTIVDTAITICERIDAYRITGSWQALIHTEAAYNDWLREAERILGLANFTSNLEPHGTTYFKYISDLGDAIEKGEAIAKYSRKTSGTESTFLQKRLASLHLLKNTEVTRRAAQRERKAPFGVLIHGGSSVGKSSFTKMLYYYYGKVHGLEIDDHFRYVRSPADQYWSNFDTSKWCIQMDDIAFLDPKKADEDPTLTELLNVVNNVPYVPPQAALEDKGRTPIMARLVLATTNTPSLNAKDYFACPLAVQRRLAYVVHIKPKDAYLAENKQFLDPTKLPTRTDGFPDFWNITVQKLVPVKHGTKDIGELQTVKEFTDVREFLKHFAEASVQHERNQISSECSDEIMAQAKVCRLCYSVGDDCSCLQGTVVQTLWYCLSMCFYDLISNVFTIITLGTFAKYLLRYRIYNMFMARVARLMNAQAQIRYFSFANGQVRNYSVRLGAVLKALHVLASTLLLIKVTSTAVRYFHPPTPKKKEGEKKESESKDAPEHPDVGVQGNVFGTTEEQLEKETLRNVWYNPTLELSQFDVPSASKSVSNFTVPQVRDLMAHNCVGIDVKALDLGIGTRMHAVYLKGQYLCFNRHALKHGQDFSMQVFQQGKGQGITGNITCYFKRSEVHEIPELDLAVYRVKNAPPKKDILKYWNDAQIPITRMAEIRREEGGDVTYSDVFNVTYWDRFHVEELQQEMGVYIGVGTQETKSGDCGSLGVAITPQGPIIIGLHTLGYRNNCGFVHVTRSKLLEVVEGLSNAVVAGDPPKLNLNGANVLMPPHHKSLFRYLKEGVANVYGCLPGHRAKPRSRVVRTPLSDLMCEHFGCEIGFDKPVMSGWEPTFNNVKDMVRPHTNIDQGLLDHCTASFVEDIVGGLQTKHGDEWKKSLCELSDEAAINGLPGVRFIDALNKNTSMGHPWNSTKKKYLVSKTSDRFPDGVDFVPEVWDRVREIEGRYARGERAYPVFTGHLKDEPVSHSKVARKKTRLFTGAPVDWSIVCRKHLLTFVALLQKNKYIFEAAPGTVAQSKEWTDIYNYLTEHGPDQIVGGDYSAYDKGMIASFVLAAFEVIRGVLAAAGYQAQDLRYIDCIAMDTAFPVTNINGDLVEFFGTNPSGHPLTVIINSLANSLYMRYAFALLNPEARDCRGFKKFVNLMTYGDDNGMGVSPEVPWFNHTAIQAVLASIGVTYTMADKESVSRPYISIDEFSFLKRSWRFEEEVGLYTCPLEEASIHKMLTVWVPSKTIDEYAQMVAVITAANNEYFFYGREVFEKHHAFFKKVLQMEPYDKYAVEGCLPGWTDLVERFK